MNNDLVQRLREHGGRVSFEAAERIEELEARIKELESVLGRVSKTYAIGNGIVSELREAAKDLKLPMCYEAADRIYDLTTELRKADTQLAVYAKHIEALEAALIKIEFRGYFQCDNCEKLSAIAREAIRPNSKATT